MPLIKNKNVNVKGLAECKFSLGFITKLYSYYATTFGAQTTLPYQLLNLDAKLHGNKALQKQPVKHVIHRYVHIHTNRIISKIIYNQYSTTKSERILQT